MHTNESGRQGQASDHNSATPQESRASIGMLKETLASIGDDLRDIVRGEIRLSKTEIRDEMGQVGRAGGMLAGGGILGLAGFMFLLSGLVHLLGRRLPLWASASLVGSLLMLAASLLGVSAKKRLQEADLKPEQTLESLKEVTDTLTDAVRS